VYPYRKLAVIRHRRAGLILVSTIFGLGHAYQGAVGMLLVTYSGLIYGLLYILGKRNLWYTIIAHGTADTIAFLALYTGLMQKLL
jgi:membrane protease YdiL (CAAX protease family)